MKITKTVLLLSVIAVFFLYGCGKKEEPVTRIETHVAEKEEKNDQNDVVEEPKEPEQITTEEEPLEEPWKIAYGKYLYDVMAGYESIPDLLEAVNYEPDQDIRYELMDITGDNIPELLISGIPYEPDDYLFWHAYIFNPEGRVDYLCNFSFFDPDTGEVFVDDGTSFEGYSVYLINNGKAVKEYEMNEEDAEGDASPYYKVDGESNTVSYISIEEMEKFRNAFNDGYKKYRLKGIALNKENVEKDFGAPDDSKESADLSGHIKMWIKEEYKENDEDWIFAFYQEGDSSELFDSLKKTDWDNDGIYEYYLEGSISYSGIYFDMSDGKLIALYGFGPYGMGWNGVAYTGGSYWVYEASGNMEKFYDFKKYDHRHEVTDEFCYDAIYDMDDAGNEKATYKKGSNYENMSEISENEFDVMCGENGFINQDLPDLPENGDEKLTNDLYEAVKEFFEGKRPVFAIYQQ